MTSAPRLALVLLVLLILVSGIWLGRRLLTGTAPPVPPAPAATVAPVSTAVPTLTPLPTPPGYRLAGVAVGEPDSFAVIEAPNGSSALYRREADVPGLGRLVRIDAERVLVQTDTGTVELWLAPAATATPTAIPSVTRRSTPAAGQTLTPARPQPPGGGTPAGSTPSVAPDRPAS